MFSVSFNTHLCPALCHSLFTIYFIPNLLWFLASFFLWGFQLSFSPVLYQLSKSTKSLLCLHRCAETTFLWVVFFFFYCLQSSLSLFYWLKNMKRPNIFPVWMLLVRFSTYLCFCLLHWNQININSAFLCHLTRTGLPQSPGDNSWYFWEYEASTRSESFLIHGDIVIMESAILVS